MCLNVCVCACMVDLYIKVFNREDVYGLCMLKCLQLLTSHSKVLSLFTYPGLQHIYPFWAPFTFWILRYDFIHFCIIFVKSANNDTLEREILNVKSLFS